MFTQAAAIDSNDLIPMLAITVGCLVAITAIISGAVTRHARVKEREKSRREIAAYVAEGSMTPEEGERLLNAGKSLDGRKGCCG